MAMAVTALVSQVLRRGVLGMGRAEGTQAKVTLLPSLPFMAKTAPRTTTLARRMATEHANRRRGVSLGLRQCGGPSAASSARAAPKWTRGFFSLTKASSSSSSKGKGLPANALRLSPRPHPRPGWHPWRRSFGTMSEASVESGLTRGMSSTSRKWVGGWLGLCSAWVFSMVVLGGITRLTRSGLSMTEWKFAGERPPLNHEDWVKEFAKYKQSPEFKKVNLGMSLEEFKFIYWMEYGHRMWGRVLGLVFGLPFAYFAATRKLSAPLTRRLGLLMLMGGGQGLVGWWMVKSGLKEPTEYQYDVPRVSPYRLAAHLTSAFVIYSGLLWTTLSVLMPKTPMQLAQELHAAGSGVISGGRRLGRHLGLYAVLVSLTAVSGAFVAGLDAGHAYNTFPLMGDPGRVFPTDYWGHEGGDWGDWAGLDPADRVSRILANTFENTCAVQFHHRVLAVTTLLASTSLFLIHRRSPLPNHSATLLKVLCGMAWCQVGLGITTLLNYVPVHLGSAHQAGALTLMSVALASIYCTRPLKAAQAASRGAQAVLGRTVA